MALTEWFGYRSVEQLESGNFFISGLARGLIDTVAVDHPVGARVWFMDQSPITSSYDYSSGWVQAKLLTYTNSDAMTEAGSATPGVNVMGRYKLPVVPGRVMLNAGNDVEANTTYRISGLAAAAITQASSLRTIPWTSRRPGSATTCGSSRVGR